MLQKSSLEKLQTFRIQGFVDALIQQATSATTYADLSFEERLTLLIENEYTRRIDARTKRLTKSAKLPHSATLEEVDFVTKRGINKGQFLEIAAGNWLSTASNTIITGPTGTGKSYLACVIASTIIRKGLSVRFKRTNDWIVDLQTYHHKHRLSQTLANLKRVPLLIFDEWLLDRLTHTESRLLLELVESRYNRQSCLFISQFPVEQWHDRFQDPTIADAILDRVVHNAHRITLCGDSMRKILAPPVLDGASIDGIANTGKDTSLRSDNP